MKKIQIKVEMIRELYVEDDVDLTEISEVQNALNNAIEQENETAENLFYENMEVVCVGCGCTLNLDEEKKTGKCVSCEADEEDE